MFRNKYISLILTAILAVTTVFGSTAALAKNQTQKSGSAQTGGEPPYLKHGKITQADRQSAADRRAEGGATAQVVPTVTDSYGNLVPDYFGTTPNYANSDLPTVVNGVVTSGGIVKFQDPLPSIPFANPDVVSYPGSDYYEIHLQQFTAIFNASMAATPTMVRGYVQTNNGTDTSVCTAPVPGTPAGSDCTLANNTKAPAAIQYLGPIIVAKRDRPVRIKFVNDLQPGIAGDLFLPVDTTYMGAGAGPDQPMTAGLDDCSVSPNSQGNPTNPALSKIRASWCYSQNRATVHLHGGTTPWISDGTPHQWTTPAGEAAATGGSMYPEGVSVSNVPDMNGGVEPAGTLTFYYTNQESARLMFYHDHAYGLTRLNVYAGEAAGYLVTDQVEQDLIAGTNVSGGNPGNVSVLPSVGTPLILQDKTFVPNAAQLAAEDPTWNTARWGGEGNFWFPHVYMTNQNPYDMTGANPMGRWDYGPWFWPPFTGLVNGEVTNPYYDPLCNSTTTYCEPPNIPGTPVISGVPEGFMDTPLVNGKAYPVMNVTAGMARFRILNASNDRYMNLQLYVATSIINSVSITNGGAGYTMPPTVTFVNGSGDTTGKGATGIANIDPTTGAVTSVFMKTVGSGYTAVPTVVFGAPPAGGTLATGTANLYTAKTEVGMVPFNSTQNNITPFPTTWYTSGNPFSLDDRDGGVPDPTYRGPAMVQIGTEGGFLPNPVLIGNTPVNYDYNRRSITVLNVLQHGLFLGPAERADVLVDFTNFAGKTLILYNDSPAPVPAGDPRNDYYTGSPDQTSTGGAPTVMAGYGPNTRTVMQIVVAGTGGTAPVDDFSATALAALKTALPKAFAVDQDTIIVPQAPYNAAYNQTITCPGTAGCFPSDRTAYVGISDTTKTFDPIGPTGAITMAMQPKAIQELFTVDYGRMNATLGVELPNTNATIQTTIPYGYIDPLTELVSVTDKAVPIGSTGDGTQIWKITHNGVDTHVIHTHMFVMQLINRVGWDGAIKPPDANELGWKDTFRMNPLEDVIVAIRPISLVNLPFKVPNSIRLMDPTKPVGSTMGFFGVGPDGNPVTVVNDYVNFGWEYVWHCHILGHEENDMMRPMAFAVPPEAPSAPTVTPVNTPTYHINLTWTDNSVSATGFVVQRSADAAFTTVVEFTAPKAAGPAQSYTDTTAVANTPYYYRVIATDTVGATPASGFTAPLAAGYSTLTARSVPSPATQLPTPPLAPSGLTAVLQTGPQVLLTWVDNSTNETGFQVYRSTNGGGYQLITTTAANVTTFTNSPVTPGSTYQYRVRATNAIGNSAYAGPVSVTVPTIPTAPTGLTATQVTGPGVRLNWTDQSNNETGFQVYKSTNGGAYSLLTTTAANATTYTDTAVVAGGTYGYEVRAINLGGASTFAGPVTIILSNIPQAPTGLTATLITGPSIRLNWTDNSTNETGFQIYRSINGGGFQLIFTTTANIVTYTNTGLTAGNTYAYQVNATNTFGSSGFAGPVSVTIATVPAAPTGLTLTLVTGPAIQVAWTDNSTNETGFQIYRSVNGGAFQLLTTTAANAITYTNTGLTAGTTYAYEVRAAGTTGNSAFAGPISLAVPAIPAAPTNLTLTALTGPSIRLNWTDNSTNETGFQIYRSINGGAYTLLTTTAANATTYTNSGLTTGNTYSYEVRAINLGGNSAFAGPISRAV